jgi:hypothetical protein
MSEPQVHENRERNKNRDCSWPGVVEVLYRFPTGRADQPLRLGAFLFNSSLGATSLLQRLHRKRI